MGRLAAELSDVAIVTSDNPRTEDPESIGRMIMEGVRQANGAGGDAIQILDRRAAIVHAIGLAKPGDVVVIAGKGHEDYQILGAEKIHFDDREEARKALSNQ
jgi:UDP-N-acetylmuramoyl-L-alanyl-D-glutamate--2,6-diaminopimelate ligase